MTTDSIKELVKRLKRTVYRSDWDDTIVYANPDGVAAADALEAMAGEVENLKHDIARHMTIANEAAAERDRLKAALDIAKAHAKQNQRARDLVSPYPNDHAKRIVWEKALYHEGKDLWDKLRKALGGDAS